MKYISIFLLFFIALLMSSETSYSQGGSCFPEDSAIALRSKGGTTNL
ncbi:MAG: hypothetical protein RIF34_04675 [Candidatus Kapaibacterium sp.]